MRLLSTNVRLRPESEVPSRFRVSYRDVNQPVRQSELVRVAAQRLPGRDFIPRYRELREVTRIVNQRMVDMLTPNLLDSGLRPFGMDIEVYFDLPDELRNTLLDFILHRAVSRRRSFPERLLLRKNGPKPDTDAGRILRGYLNARWALCLVEKVIPGVGVVMTDLLRGEGIALTDEGMSRPENMSAIVALRLVELEDCCISTGVALGFHFDDMAELLESTARMRIGGQPAMQCGELAGAGEVMAEVSTIGFYLWQLTQDEADAEPETRIRRK